MSESVLVFKSGCSHSVYRLLNIIVERLQPEDEVFCEAVPTALREYADALETDAANAFSGKPHIADSDCIQFRASNGCEMKVIAGAITK
jgi:hypothetical protein